MGHFAHGQRDAITDVRGIRVGHWTDKRGGTGCTVVRCEGALGVAVDVRGGAPGTRETDVLDGANLVRTCHAIVLSGGSVFGLEAASGVTRYLADESIGFETPNGRVPIVPAAVIYDLGVGKAKAAPDATAGYRAASRASGGHVAEGSVGAGTGATVAKMMGPDHAVKGGAGTASVVGPRGLVVGALVVVNAIGIVTDAETGEVVAGPRGDVAGTTVQLGEALERRTAEMDALVQNTSLVVVATNADIEHGLTQRLSYHAHDGLARALFPAHSNGDGDSAFAIAMGQVETRPHDAVALGAMVTEAVERAVLKSARAAQGLHGVPSASEWAARQ